jgi:transposase
MYHTKGRDLEQECLLPVNIKKWLPEDDFSQIIIDIVSILDLIKIYSAHREDGQDAAFYYPEIMTVIAQYSYVRGARSSREIFRSRDLSLTQITLFVSWATALFNRDFF